jgi:hypothetical protein
MRVETYYWVQLTLFTWSSSCLYVYLSVLKQHTLGFSRGVGNSKWKGGLIIRPAGAMVCKTVFHALYASFMIIWKPQIWYILSHRWKYYEVMPPPPSFLSVLKELQNRSWRKLGGGGPPHSSRPCGYASGFLYSCYYSKYSMSVYNNIWKRYSIIFSIYPNSIQYNMWFIYLVVVAAVPDVAKT